MKLTENIKNRWLDASYIPLIVTASITVIVIYLLFGKTQDVLRERLQERLVAIAATAALQFSEDELNAIRSEEDLDKQELRDVIFKLKQIRASNNNLKFIYILRPTNDYNVMSFIADAETLATLEEVDENENGIIDEEELPPLPGDEYDISELPQLKNAIFQPTADEELNSDKWGTFLSGYAPIIDKSGKTTAILGIDVQVDDFYTLVSATLLPFTLLAALLLALITFQTLILIRIWHSRVEIVKELDRQKDELISIVSHQLATPITSIKWYVEMLLDGDLGKITDEQTVHLKSMQSVAADLNDLVGMILNVSRIQLGRIKIDKQQLDLNEFFKEILQVIEPKAQEKKVKFNVKLPQKLPVAMLDKRYTRMTIENLLSNAVKYTPENGTVDFTVEIKDGRMLCVVRDAGCGIPKQDQGKIFGKLYRACNVRNAVEGNGFGLYVAKGAVEAQNGKIWFESTEGKGTTFVVVLPLGEVK